MLEVFKFMSPALKAGLENENTAISQLYTDYFSEGSPCGNAFVYDIIVALVVALIFYFIFCNKKIMSRFFWCIALLICGVIAFSITDLTIIGTYDDANETGFYASMEETRDILLDPNNTNESNEEISTDIDIHKEEIYTDLSLDSLRVQFGLTNVLLAVFAFIIISAIFKRFTIHGKNIPF